MGKQAQYLAPWTSLNDTKISIWSLNFSLLHSTCIHVYCKSVTKPYCTKCIQYLPRRSKYDCNTKRSCWSQCRVNSLECLIKVKSSLTWALAYPLLVALVYCSALLAISLVLQTWTRNKNRVIIFNIVSRFTTSFITTLLWYKIVKFNSTAAL